MIENVKDSMSTAAEDSGGKEPLEKAEGKEVSCAALNRSQRPSSERKLVDSRSGSRGAEISAIVVAAVNVILLILISIQTYLLSSQTKLQQDVADRMWESQQIAAIYETGKCEKPPCPPVASIRLRAEAVKSYIALRRRNGQASNLQFAD